MKILITGGCGFIGLPLTETCIRAGHDVLVLDNFATAGPERFDQALGVNVEDCDLRDAALTAKLTQSFRPDRIIHLAALHFIPYCEAHPVETFHVNMNGTQSVLAASRLVDGPPILFTSSAAVYPISDQPLTEDTPLQPVDSYGYSKWAGELLMERQARQDHSSVTVFRTFNVFGPRETNPHVVPRILDQLKNGDVLELGNLDSRRDFINVDDVVDAILWFLNNAPDGYRVFNLGTGRATSISELVELVERILGRDIRIVQKPSLMRTDDRPILEADVTKMRNIGGWRAERTLTQGLESLLAPE